MRSQQGFVLFELLLGAAVALLIVVWAGQALSNRVSDASAQQSARWMLIVRNAVHNYLEHHGEHMRLAVAQADLMANGYQDWSAPTLAELRNDGLLAAGFPDRVRPVGGIRIRIIREGGCPGEQCRLGAVLYGEQPFMKTSGVVDEQMLAQWLLSAEGLGGMVHPSRPNLIRGPTFQYPNLLEEGTVLPPGTVVMTISDDQLNASAYLRVRDHRDPEFQSDATVQGTITAGGVVSAGEYLHVGKPANWLDTCAVEGAISRDALRGVLICSGGAWQMGTRSPGGFSVNSLHGCFTPDGSSSANPITRACSCPAGHVPLPISEGGGGDEARGITQGFLCVR